MEQAVRQVKITTLERGRWSSQKKQNDHVKFKSLSSYGALSLQTFIYKLQNKHEIVTVVFVTFCFPFSPLKARIRVQVDVAIYSVWYVIAYTKGCVCSAHFVVGNLSFKTTTFVTGNVHN